MVYLCVNFKTVNCHKVVRRDSEPYHSGEQTQCFTKVIQSSISTQQLGGQGTLACSNNNNEGSLSKSTSNLSSRHLLLHYISFTALKLAWLKHQSIPTCP